MIQPAEKVAAARRLLRLKLVWLQNKYGVPWSRVWNMDETAANWAVFGDTKALATVTIAVGAVEGVRHQIIFQGKTNRVHPIGPQPEDQQVTHTESSWSSVNTLLEMVRHIDKHINQNNDDKPHDWILLVDCAPVHISEEFRGEMNDKWPWVHMCFVAPGFTASCQPLDISYMEGFKSRLRNLCGEQLASAIVACGDADACIAIDSSRKVLCASLLGYVNDACGKLENDLPRNAGWKHLLVSEEDHASVLEDAIKAHQAGELFSSGNYEKPEDM
jgi:hypothetical protein